MKKTVVAITCLLVVASALSARGRSQAQPAAQSGKLAVVVSIPPQKYFVDRIAGDAVSVSVLVPDGRSPHDYDPTPRQVSTLGAAEVYFSIGVEFETAFVPRLKEALPNLRIVDTRAGIKLRQMKDAAAGQSAGQSGSGGRGAFLPDPHIWLGPREVEQQARTIRDALSQLRPDEQSIFDAGYQSFIVDIRALNADLSASLAPLAGSTILVYHPSFGYFADTYDLVQEAVETGGSAPTPRQLSGIIQRAIDEGVKVVFVEPQFSQAGANRIASAIGGAVVSVDPLAYDWLSNMRDIAAKIRAAMPGAGASGQ